MASLILRVGAVASVLVGAASAQIEITGTLDVAYKYDVGKQSKEVNSRINSEPQGQEPLQSRPSAGFRRCRDK